MYEFITNEFFRSNPYYRDHNTAGSGNSSTAQKDISDFVGDRVIKAAHSFFYSIYIQCVYTYE